MADDATMRKRKKLTIGGVALLLWPALSLMAIGLDRAAGGAEVATFLVQLGALAALVASVVFLPWAAFLYWRDWYGS